MKLILGLVLLGLAAVLAWPSNFRRTVAYFVYERHKIGIREGKWNQSLALAGFIAGLVALGLVLIT